jgi:hypothetical protein
MESISENRGIAATVNSISEFLNGLALWIRDQNPF